MQDKVVMVTGATNGIGEITALELARQGATVVVVGRTLSKLEDTVARIKSETGNQNISYIQADLSSMAEVRNAAEQFLAQFERLDVLVNNAGAYFAERKTTADGYEMTLALNHLNYFLLTDLLLDTIKQTAETQGEARIVNVSSDAHQAARIKFDDIQATNYSSFGRYGESKLMNIMFTYALARRLEGTKVSTNALHPGLVETGFGKNNGGMSKFFISILSKFFGKSPEEGAETNIYLAASPEAKGITGKYWADKQQKQSNKASYDVDAQERLWSISEELVGIAQPEQVA
ncbi:MAG: SDR family oxidoreductase [Chloroflexota bacterium]